MNLIKCAGPCNDKIEEQSRKTIKNYEGEQNTKIRYIKIVENIKLLK